MARVHTLTGTLSSVMTVTKYSIINNLVGPHSHTQTRDEYLRAEDFYGPQATR